MWGISARQGLQRGPQKSTTTQPVELGTCSSQVSLSKAITFQPPLPSFLSSHVTYYIIAEGNPACGKAFCAYFPELFRGDEYRFRAEHPGAKGASFRPLFPKFARKRPLPPVV